jgi:protease-4
LHLDAERGKPAVAVIVASGTIYDGKQRAGNIGGDTLAAQLREAAREDDIKALVLRIDSPGGSGFASEIVRGALLEFRASGKPIVASMSSVAASGGYWIAAPADEIWASETTLTGSIGVLSAFPSFVRGLAEIGITSDGVGTTALAGGPDPTRALDPKWRSVLGQLNSNAYDRFLDVVAEGRALDRAKVAEVAEGRVWTGEQAVSNGLVDKLGNLEQAITAAAQLAKLDDYSTRWLEPPADWRARLMAAFAGAPDALMAQVLGVEAAETLRRGLVLETLLGASDPRTPWALCTACGVY